MDPSDLEDGALFWHELRIAHYHVDVQGKEELIRQIYPVLGQGPVGHVPAVVLGDQLEEYREDN